MLCSKNTIQNILYAGVEVKREQLVKVEQKTHEGKAKRTLDKESKVLANAKRVKAGLEALQREELKVKEEMKELKEVKVEALAVKEELQEAEEQYEGFVEVKAEASPDNEVQIGKDGYEEYI